MIDKNKLTQFLLKARIKAYAKGKVRPVFVGSIQREYSRGNWFYRDVYYSGEKIFVGLEVVYYKKKPVWSMCYYGSFREISKDELDKILRKALMENWENVRIWKKVEWEEDEYKYICQPDYKGSIDECAGLERIFKQKKEVYRLYYAGGLLI